MYSTHEATLPIPGLPPAARKVHIVPDLASHSLLSIGQLCDAGCTVSFTATDCTIQYDDVVVLHGKRPATTGLWHIDMPDSPVPLAPTANGSVGIPTPESFVELANGSIGTATPADLVAFDHAALFSPALSTLESALSKNFLTNFPGLTTATLRKHPPHSGATIKGHLDQSRQNQRSTKPAVIPADFEPDSTFDFPEPLSESPDGLRTGERTHFVYAAVSEPTGQVYTDQTGRFIIPSSTGNNYLLVLYDYDSNSILAEPMKNRTAKSILAAYKSVHAKLCAAGLRPKLQRLDNECSQVLKDFMHEEEVDFQLVTPGSHRRNAAERAIRTFKNHFVAGLCSVDKDFPLHLWDRLLPQAILTLNLLRGSRMNPKLSAWAQLHGTFDFNRTPIAPPGIKVIVHEKPDKRTSWSPHGVDGWYIGPASDSYRCYKVWVWDTRAERICDTISWFPQKLGMPIASSTDLILAGIKDILHALKHPSPASPLAPLGADHVATLVLLSELITGLTSPKPDESTEPLRVPVEADPAPPLRVPSPPIGTSPSPPSNVPHLIPPDETEAPVQPAPTTNPVPTFPSDRPIVTAPSAPTPVPTAPTPTESPSVPPTTFDNSTGPRGTRRRRQARHKPSTRTRARPNGAPAQHPHGTRSKRAPHHPQTAASTIIEQHALHGNAFNPDTGTIAEYHELSQCSDGALWQSSNADEIGRLAQGRGPDHPEIEGTNTIFFIPRSAIPKGRKATYLRVVSAFRPEKTNPRRVRWTVGGDRVDYPGVVTTQTADITTAKILINSTLSTPNAKMFTTDLKDFYLGTPMERFEYMRIPLHMIPDEIMDLYNLHDLVEDGFVYVEVRKGMYGLPQAGKLANDRLTKFLEPHGYVPTGITPGLWKHVTRDIHFTLVVDDFAVKYTALLDAQHLLGTLEQLYVCSTDWTASRYCGLTLHWDYVARTCDVSMPGYIERALLRFKHEAPARPELSPHAWTKPVYGAKVQYATAPDTSEPLDAADTKRLQEVLGTFLFYARAIDSTMLPAIGTLASQQSNGTKAALIALTQLLNYAASNPDAVIRFHASDMSLHVSSDASYLTAPKARSRAAGYHYLSARPSDPTKPPRPTDPEPPSNGAIHVPCHIMREVLSSAAEAELGALFHNGKEACPLRACLIELGHPQPPTPIQTDNSTAAGIANDSVKQKRSKAMDMRFYWIRDRVRQGQFLVYWRKGSSNRADYFTKHHPASHHKAIRSSYLHEPNDRSKNYFESLQDNANHSNSKRVVNFASQTDCSEGVLNTQAAPARARARARRPAFYPAISSLLHQ
jgi:hypothetical protein